MPLLEVNRLPVDPAVVTLEMPCPLLVEIPSELVCDVPNVEPVPLALGEKLTVDVRGAVPTNLNKKRRYNNSFLMV